MSCEANRGSLALRVYAGCTKVNTKEGAGLRQEAPKICFLQGRRMIPCKCGTKITHRDIFTYEEGCHSIQGARPPLRAARSVTKWTASHTLPFAVLTQLWMGCTPTGTMLVVATVLKPSAKADMDHPFLGIQIPENVSRAIPDWLFPDGTGSFARHQSHPYAVLCALSQPKVGLPTLILPRSLPKTGTFTL
eukprot:65219-Pelagomonas_calceolata.AAC.2